MLLSVLQQNPLGNQSENVYVLSILQQKPLGNQSEHVYYPSFHLAAKYTLEPIEIGYLLFCSSIHSRTNQKPSTIYLAAESTREPIRSRLLSILQQNPLGNQSEVAYNQSCSRIHPGTNQKSPTINLAAESTRELIRSRLLSILEQNLYSGTYQMLATINLATESTL
jgi:hypothetical protein